MYTVMRFFDATNTVDLEQFGFNLNEIRRELYTGMDKVPGRFSCSLCTDESWSTHKAAIIGIIATCSDIINAARKLGIEITIDIALEPNDYKSAPYFSIPFDRSLLKVLHDHDISFAVSIYLP